MNYYQGTVALRNLHTTHCFASHLLTQYVVESIFSATTPS